MLGMWVDIYMQVAVSTVHHMIIGWVEIGSFLGYIGLFGLVLAYSLRRAPLIARNHPYLEESLKHHA